MGHYFRYTGMMAMAMLSPAMSGPTRTCWRTARGTTPPPWSPSSPRRSTTTRRSPAQPATSQTGRGGPCRSWWWWGTLPAWDCLLQYSRVCYQRVTLCSTDATPMPTQAQPTTPGMWMANKLMGLKVITSWSTTFPKVTTTPSSSVKLEMRLASQRKQKPSKFDVSNQNINDDIYEIFSISDGPKVLRQPDTVSADLGDSATLHCHVDSNPPPKYTWTKGDSRQVTILRDNDSN